MFSGSVVEDLTFIRNAQGLGFSLQEIRELLDVKRASHSDCRHVEQLLEHKLSVVHTKIAALRNLEDGLTRAVDNCKSNLRSRNDGPADDCPVLSGMSHAKGRAKR